MAAALLAGACSSDDNIVSPTTSAATTIPIERCEEAADAAIQPLQGFVDEHADLTPEEWNELNPPPTADAEQEEMVAIAQAAVDNGCNPSFMEERLAARIAGLTGKGEVGQAIAAALRGDGPFVGPPVPVVGTTVPRNAVPTTVTLEPGASLADLLDRLAPGSTVRFVAGEYRFTEPILIDMDLEFEGAGVDDTVLTSTADGVALAFVGPGGFSMRDLTIEHTGDKEASVFLAIEGPVTIEDAALRGGVAGDEAVGGGHGVVFAYENLGGFPEREEYQRSGTLSISRTTITDNAAAGILVTGSAAPVLVDVEVSDNGGCGVCYSGTAGGSVGGSSIERNEIGMQVGDQASVRVKGNRVSHNVSVGVSVDGASALDLSTTTIEENGDVGVQVTGGATVSIERSTIRLHGVGVLSAGDARVTITDSGVVDHEVGVQAGGAANVDIDDTVIWLSSVAAISFGEQSRGTAARNEIDQAANVGIQVVDEAAGELTDNVIDNAGKVGIQVIDAATADVDGNVIGKPGAVGISYAGTSAGTARDNRVNDREVGIQVGGSATPRLTANVITDSVAVGILFGDQARGSADANQVTSAEAVGLLVGGSSAPTVSANRLVGNGVGLVFRESASGVASGNTIDQQSVGVQIVDDAVPTIDGNTVTNSQEAGVVYAGNARGALLRNTLELNGNVALQVGDAAAPTVTENVLRGPGVSGTIYRDNAAGTFRGNRVVNQVYGVQLNGSAAPALVDNSFEEIALTSMVYAENSGGANRGNACSQSFSAGISVTPPASPDLGDNGCTVGRSG